MTELSVEQKKEFAFIYREARTKAKRSRCVLCNKKADGFVKSHSIPKSILENISEQGWISSFEQVAGLENKLTGIGKAGTFYLLCYDCEHRYFKHYEDVQLLCEKPTDILMAEIALKNSLYQLDNSDVEKEVCKILSVREIDREYYINRTQVVEQDIVCFEESVSFFQQIIDNNEQDGFQLLHWRLLPYTIPIAVQSQIPLGIDPYGSIINDNFDYSSRTESMHLAAFPLQKQSVVIAFYHKRDRKNRIVRDRFKRLTNLEILKYLNYVVWATTSNIFLAPQIFPVAENKNLRRLACENNGLPNLGCMVRSWNDLFFIRETYTSPHLEEIPNLLEEQYAIPYNVETEI